MGAAQMLRGSVAEQFPDDSPSPQGRFPDSPHLADPELDSPSPHGQGFPAPMAASPAAAGVPEPEAASDAAEVLPEEQY